MAKIRRNRMTFRRFGSLQSWRELCPPFLSTSRCDRNTIEPSKLFVSCEPLRIIIEEKPNSEPLGSMCVLTCWSRLSLFFFFFFFFNQTYCTITFCNSIKRINICTYIGLYRISLCYYSYLLVISNYDIYVWRYIEIRCGLMLEVMKDWITTLFKQY